MKSYREVLDWLYTQLPMYQRLGQSAIRIDLENTQRLLEHLGNPQENLSCIHVAGTNGKGSVCHMLASIFQSAGYKTGLYTSPHLKDFRERIRVNGNPISEEEVVAFTQEHQGHFRKWKPSFFEMTVGMALDHFRSEETDIALIEVGMGGRLDSTNLVQPRLSIITNIGYDHQQFLGDTLAKIAAEKAGIIKKGVPVLIGQEQEETRPVFEEHAHRLEAPLHFAERLFPHSLEHFPSDLKGDYQQYNKRTVLAAVELLENQGYDLRDYRMAGLALTAKNTGLRGRWEQLGEKPDVYCDTAHNKEGLQMVLKQIENRDFDQLHIVWGMVREKDIMGLLELLPRSAHYYFCRPDIPRGLDTTILSEQASALGLRGEVYPSVASALEAARNNARENDFIYVGGSTFVVAEL